MTRTLVCLSFALRRLRRAERGATSTEYAIMASLVAGVIILAVTVFGQEVNSLFHEVEIRAAMGS